jgi:hypothetical protein
MVFLNYSCIISAQYSLQCELMALPVLFSSTKSVKKKEVLCEI